QSDPVVLRRYPSELSRQRDGYRCAQRHPTWRRKPYERASIFFLPTKTLLGLVNDPWAALNHLVVIRQAIECFGGPQKQVPARFERPVNTQQDVALHLGGEVDQHVTAKHDVEFAQHRIVVQQVEGTELDT